MQKHINFQTLIKYFFDNFSVEILLDQKETKTWLEKKAFLYFEKIMELESTFKKIERYPIYFSEFYSEKIPESEAIEYHWHSYIEDFYILKVRLVEIFGSLKNDLKEYDSGNKEFLIKLIEHSKKQVTRGLERAVTFRGSHTHQKTARNFDLTRANLFQLMQVNKDQLKKYYNLNLEKINIKTEELTKKSKQEFIDMAERNNKEMEKVREFFAEKFGFIFSYLNNHDTSIFTSLKLDEVRGAGEDRNEPYE